MTGQVHFTLESDKMLHLHSIIMHRSVIGLTIVIDTVMWQYIVWPELKVLWFNSVLNRSSEWGTHAFHWYFTSALPRSLLAAYPLVMGMRNENNWLFDILYSSLQLGLVLDRRIRLYILPVFSFVLIYSKLPHKELRFIIAAIPMFNLAAAIAAGRIYNNRKKGVWSWLYFILIGSFLVSLGCSVILFMASYDNYPGGYALKALHQMANETNYTEDQSVHIGTFSAMNGVSRFCEHSFPWRYSKEEGIAIEELCHRDFTYLLNEHSRIDGFKCLYAISSFSGVRVQRGFPPILLIKEPKVFIHGNMRDKDTMHSNWPGCS
ncbi:hypothetical protein GIB67_027315 [Kingdonia uniflora]|uniref:Mannosyltransferase n=1 Tax=Kingdonia uniflora TaxID=39325 RepID=A0A7J7KYK1_9MAGN|nr:hypothetical protein GIB67_027315 [Kingdonia uniflora]